MICPSSQVSLLNKYIWNEKHVLFKNLFILMNFQSSNPRIRHSTFLWYMINWISLIEQEPVKHDQKSRIRSINSL